jgi:hypothetical protein
MRAAALLFELAAGCVDEWEHELDVPRANTPGVVQATTTANASAANRMGSPSCKSSGNHAPTPMGATLRRIKAGSNGRPGAFALGRHQEQRATRPPWIESPDDVDTRIGTTLSTSHGAKIAVSAIVADLIPVKPENRRTPEAGSRAPTLSRAVSNEITNQGLAARRAPRFSGP